MRDDWEIKDLGDVCGYQNGFAFKSKTYRQSGTPVIRISDIQDNKLDLSGIVHVDPNDYKKDLSRYEIVKGDLLIAMSGATTGKIGIVQADDTFLLNQRVGKFEPKDALDKKYLFYYLLGKVEEVLSMSAGSAQPNLSTRQIKGFQIPLPPLEEQKRIVAILDEAFEAIDRAKANIERNIENTEELFQSKLNKIFKNNSEGWNPKKLGEIGELISGQHIKSDNYNNERRGIGYLTGPSDFGEIYPIITKWTEHPKRTARAKDILITVKGSGVGKINLMDKDELAISRQLKALRVTEANTRFVYLFLSLQYDYLQDLANGAAIPGLSISDIMELEISIPYEKIQNQLVDEIISFESQITDIVENYKKKLNSLRELKKSILQQAFSGELTKQQELVA